MDQSLHELLERLRHEIDKAELGQEDLDLLADLAGEVEDRIEHGEGEPHPLVARLREGVDRFEAEHPRLSEAMGRAADALSALGL